ncbi:MAG: oligosaccharide flippase family protein [Bacteroidetes bacterium]|nr:oligosaccharide flippase family protein [Bacteroidota bacterium]
MTERKQIIGNTVALGFMQAANYLTPLLVIPFLFRVIGKEGYGQVIFIQAIMSYFNIIVDYGFNLTGTRTIGQCTSSEERNTAFIRIQISKIVLLFATVIPFIGIILWLDTPQDRLNYFYGFLMVVGNAFFPVWYFQGIKKMRILTIINVISKFISIGLIFLFIRESTQIGATILLLSSGWLISGLIGFGIALKLENFRIQIPPYRAIMKELKLGWHVFISRVLVSTYGSTNVLILGYYAGDGAVGIFGVADKMIKAGSSLAQPLVQATFPNMAQWFISQRDKYIKMRRQFTLGLSVVFVVGAFVIYYLAGPIAILLQGNKDENIVNLLHVTSFVILLLPFGPIFSNFFVIEHKERKMSRILLYSAILNFIVIIPLVKAYAEIGVLYTLIIVYAFVSLMKGLNLFLNTNSLRNYGNV